MCILCLLLMTGLLCVSYAHSLTDPHCLKHLSPVLSFHTLGMTGSGMAALLNAVPSLNF